MLQAPFLSGGACLLSSQSDNGIGVLSMEEIGIFAVIKDEVRF